MEYSDVQTHCTVKEIKKNDLDQLAGELMNKCAKSNNDNKRFYRMNKNFERFEVVEINKLTTR